MQSSRWKIASSTEERLKLSGWWPLGAARCLEITRERLSLSLFRDVLSLHPKDITSLRCSVHASESGSLLFIAQLTHTSSGEPRLARLSFQVKNINRYEDALQLLFRVAQILDWGFYTLHRKEDAGFEVTLQPTDGGPFRADSQNTKEVPPSSIQTLRYLMDEANVRPHFQAPDASVSEFQPGQLGHVWSAIWEPGKRVQLSRSASRGVLWAILHTLFVVPFRFVFMWMFAAFLVSGIVVAVMIALALLPSMLIGLLSITAQEIFLWGIGGLVGVLSLAYLTYFVVRDTLRSVLRSFSYSAALDWEKDQLLTTRAKYFSTTTPLSHVQAISFVECSDDLSDTNDKIDKWCEVRALLGWRWVALWESRQYSDPSQQANTGRSLAVSLARSLDVPFREETD